MNDAITNSKAASLPAGAAPSNRKQPAERRGRPTTVHDCKQIELKKIADPRGNLTFIEGGRHIPFEIKRVFYLYDVPGGATRAAHAHVELEQLIVAMSGSFDVLLDDGIQKR